ncbi:hypothetical protein ACVJH7_000327, partial [Bradyrhizobium elkanii]
MPDVNDEGERHARRERDRAWAARQARQLNADCEEEIARRHGARFVSTPRVAGSNPAGIA